VDVEVDSKQKKIPKKTLTGNFSCEIFFYFLYFLCGEFHFNW